MVAYNVLLWQDKDENPQQIPGAWPAEYQPVADDAPLPAAPWRRMSQQERSDYEAAHWPEYQAWQQAMDDSRNGKLAELDTEYQRRVQPLSDARQNIENLIYGAQNAAAIAAIDVTAEPAWTA